MLIMAVAALHQPRRLPRIDLLSFRNGARDLAANRVRTEPSYAAGGAARSVYRAAGRLLRLLRQRHTRRTYCTSPVIRKTQRGDACAGRGRRDRSVRRCRRDQSSSPARSVARPTTPTPRSD